MKRDRLLVVFHVYYHDQVPYFIDKMRNIHDCEWDMIITYSEYSPCTESLLKSFKPDVRMIQVENVGYDVWPFVKVLEMVNLDEYDYIMKLHTKRDIEEKKKIQKIRLDMYGWRKLLVDALLKSRYRFRRCLDLLRRNSQIGLVCSYELLKELDGILPEDTWQLENEARRVGIDLSGNLFCAGTMFLVRAEPMKKIKDLGLDVNFWEPKSKSESIGTPAHVYERLLCFAVSDAGYRLRGVPTNLMLALQVFEFKNIRPTRKRLKRKLKQRLNAKAQDDNGR